MWLFIPVLLGLFALELGYLKLADYFNIIDKPNQRSSHTIPTIRGGGVIFVFALLGFTFIMDKGYWPLSLAVFLSAAISFIDDLRSLPTWLRAGFHFVSVTIIWYFLGGFEEILWLYPVVLILSIGTVNAYNFMDGINGITGWYSLAILLPLILSERGQTDQNLMIWIAISLVVFNFFNSRLKARCFAGDVGSVGIALLLIYFVLDRMLFDGQWQLIFLFTLYGIDAVFTIIQRLYEKENIFDAHRKHLYQYLANEMKWSHLTVAGLYFFLQILINSILVFFEPRLSIIFSMVLLLAAVYIVVKRWIYVHKIRPKF